MQDTSSSVPAQVQWMDSTLDGLEPVVEFAGSVVYEDLWMSLPYRWALPIPVDWLEDPGDPVFSNQPVRGRDLLPTGLAPGLSEGLLLLVDRAFGVAHLDEQAQAWQPLSTPVVQVNPATGCWQWAHPLAGLAAMLALTREACRVWMLQTRGYPAVAFGLTAEIGMAPEHARTALELLLRLDPDWQHQPTQADVGFSSMLDQWATLTPLEVAACWKSPPDTITNL